MRIRLTLACWDYDRTRALADGSVRPEGIDLVYLHQPVEETFFRMMRFQEFDASEMSLSSYVASLDSDKPPFIAIPVFPSRYFRHSCIFVSAKSGIRKPEDLKGKRIGVPEYQMTAPVWIRGILSDDYGVKVTDVAALLRRRRGARPRREVEARPAIHNQALAHRPDTDPLPHARRRRAGRARHRPRALDVLLGAGQGEAPVPGLRRAGEGVLPAHEDLPDHAHRGDPARRLRGEPLGRAVALQGVRRGKGKRLRQLYARPQRCRHAAVAGLARRRGEARDGRGLVALRPRAEPPRAGDLPALPPRAGAVEASLYARRTLRPGNAGLLQGVREWIARRSTRLTTTARR